ncbi:hypothetical protein K2173_024208 [Erythroxylum novogranatense]|uniref:Uncharacterized protein n=1 Tax=Erythroxylum novogranatense TaxID=1862640 RepID=A0AAV8UFL6_9ROSI|nr:hypothetical protein K2173_024208 [Erythroxylum novogranatense]
MPGLAQRNEQFSNGSSGVYSISANGFWSKHRDDVSYNQLQKFWCELSPQARHKLLRIDKHALFEQARKNMYCSRCNGLLLEGFLQIVMYGKSLQQEGGGSLPCSRLGDSKNQSDGELNTDNGRDPSVHPWGGLTTTRDGSLTLLDCYLYSKSLKGLQNVFDSARARERERELLYPDACGGGGRGWISQGMASYGRGHGTRETCALHTARLSCDTLVDFWSALGEETRLSLLRMKEEDFIERLMYRFDSKRFCRDCRRNVIREFKELKELKRMRRETRCTNWFCVADTRFQYEVSDDSVQADWRQAFADSDGAYHHFEWAIGSGEGKTDILEFENVGTNGNVQVSGLDLTGLTSCHITLRAWKLDGRCNEYSVKAHSLKGQQCVHCRLLVGDGFVTITEGESIRRFFEHAEEAEEEEDDDSMDKDGNELDGECSRPQKHAKSPELAREFLLDAATVIFKEQVEKAFREGTARQNAHSIFVCLALKLLEERVHVACKEIITLEKQMKLLEEEEKEKREEEERKERRRTKEREKKLRRKERLKGKERDKEKKLPESDGISVLPDVLKDEPPSVDEEPSNAIDCRDSTSETGDTYLSRPRSPDIQVQLLSNEHYISSTQNESLESPYGEFRNLKDETSTFTIEQSKFSRRRLKFRKDNQFDQSLKWSDRRRLGVGVESGAAVNKSDSRLQSENVETTSRGIDGTSRQLRINGPKCIGRSCGLRFCEKFHCSNNRMNERFDFHACCFHQSNDSRSKVESYVSTVRVGRERKSVGKSESALDASKQFYRAHKYNQTDSIRDGCGRPKSRCLGGNNSSSRDIPHSRKVWEPMESQKKHPRSNSDTDITLRSSTVKTAGVESNSKLTKSYGDTCSIVVTENSCAIDQRHSRQKGLGISSFEAEEGSQSGDQAEVNDPCSSRDASCEEVSSCVAKSSDLGATPEGSTSISDNCSSSTSEGDSNPTSSNHGILESSSTSDSEDASQQSDGTDTMYIQNGFPTHEELEYGKRMNSGYHNGLLNHEAVMENKVSTNGGEALGNMKLSGSSPDGPGRTAQRNLHSKSCPGPDNGILTVSVGSHHQGVFSPVHNQSIQFPLFQAPSAFGYYHQNPVSWPATPAHGLMPFPHPNQYLYAGSLGYDLNGNSSLCMQYSPVQHLANPVFTPGPVPAYKPLSKANGLNSQEHKNAHKGQTIITEATGERIPSAAQHCPEAQPGEGMKIDNIAKLRNGDSGFSLFHFGGPVALSTGNKQDCVPSKAGNGELSSKIMADEIENDSVFNKKETTMEEYNLFAASNGLRFSFF